MPNSLGNNVTDLLSLIYISTPPSNRLVTKLSNFEYASTLNDVPVTCTSPFDVFTMNGLFSSLLTSKYASPSKETVLFFFENSVGYLNSVFTFNQRLVLSERIKLTRWPAGTMIVLYCSMLFSILNK